MRRKLGQRTVPAKSRRTFKREKGEVVGQRRGRGDEKKKWVRVGQKKKKRGGRRGLCGFFVGGGGGGKVGDKEKLDNYAGP